jgi:hypothetical protein
MISPSTTPLLPLPHQSPLERLVNGLPSPITSERSFGDVPNIASRHLVEENAEDRRAQRRPAPLRRIGSHRQELEIAIQEDKEVRSWIPSN